MPGAICRLSRRMIERLRHEPGYTNAGGITLAVDGDEDVLQCAQYLVSPHAASQPAAGVADPAAAAM